MWKPVQDTDDCARSIGHADARLRLLIYPSQSAIYLVKIRFDNRLNRMVVVFVGERNWMIPSRELKCCIHCDAVSQKSAKRLAIDNEPCA
jgi:hypothetical protein